MSDSISYFIENDKRTETITEFICPECKQRYWFSKDGFCLLCGTKLIFNIKLKEHTKETDASVIRGRL